MYNFGIRINSKWVFILKSKKSRIFSFYFLLFARCKKCSLSFNISTSQFIFIEIFITPSVILVTDREFHNRLFRPQIDCYTLLILSRCTWTENVPLIRFYGDSTEYTHWPLVTFWRAKVQVSKSPLCSNSRRKRLL